MDRPYSEAVTKLSDEELQQEVNYWLPIVSKTVDQCDLLYFVQGEIANRKDRADLARELRGERAIALLREIFEHFTLTPREWNSPDPDDYITRADELLEN